MCLLGAEGQKGGDEAWAPQPEQPAALSFRTAFPWPLTPNQAHLPHVQGLCREGAQAGSLLLPLLLESWEPCSAFQQEDRLGGRSREGRERPKP